MFRKKTLELTASEGKVRNILEGQLNKRRPIGKVEGGKFSLYKCLGSLDQGGFFYFHITGNYAKTESGSCVTYRVLPDVATSCVLLCVTLALITVLVGLLAGKVNGDLPLTVVAVNVIMWGYSLWGMQDIGERFEARITGKEA